MTHRHVIPTNRSRTSSSPMSDIPALTNPKSHHHLLVPLNARGGAHSGKTARVSAWTGIVISPNPSDIYDANMCNFHFFVFIPRRVQKSQHTCSGMPLQSNSHRNLSAGTRYRGLSVRSFTIGQMVEEAFLDIIPRGLQDLSPGSWFYLAC